MPSKGLALKAGAHVSVGEWRFGASLEPGLSYFFEQRRFELGFSAQFTWLQEIVFWGGDGEAPRDFLILPRLGASLGLDAAGFWRLHMSVGYGVAQLRAGVEYPVPEYETRAVWSYALGAGISAGILHIEVQRLGYMTQLQDGTDVIIGPPDTAPVVTPSRRGVAGTVVSVGLVFPIPLWESDS